MNINRCLRQGFVSVSVLSLLAFATIGTAQQSTSRSDGDDVEQSEPELQVIRLIASRLGLQMTEDTDGVPVVVKIADVADQRLKVGDRIVQIDGEDVVNLEQIANYLKDPKLQSFRIKVARGSETGNLQIKVSELPTGMDIDLPQRDIDFAGMTLRPSDKGIAVVTDVSPTSQAYKSGIREGDQLVGVADIEPKSFDELETAIVNSTRDMDQLQVPLKIRRGNDVQDLSLQLRTAEQAAVERQRMAANSSERARQRDQRRASAADQAAAGQAVGTAGIATTDPDNGMLLGGLGGAGFGQGNADFTSGAGTSAIAVLSSTGGGSATLSSNNTVALMVDSPSGLQIRIAGGSGLTVAGQFVAAIGFDGDSRRYLSAQTIELSDSVAAGDTTMPQSPEAGDRPAVPNPILAGAGQGSDAGISGVGNQFTTNGGDVPLDPGIGAPVGGNVPAAAPVDSSPSGGIPLDPGIGAPIGPVPDRSDVNRPVDRRSNSDLLSGAGLLTLTPLSVDASGNAVGVFTGFTAQQAVGRVLIVMTTDNPIGAGNRLGNRRSPERAVAAAATNANDADGLAATQNGTVDIRSGRPIAVGVIGILAAGAMPTQVGGETSTGVGNPNGQPAAQNTARQRQIDAASANARRNLEAQRANPPGLGLPASSGTGSVPINNGQSGGDGQIAPQSDE